MNAYTHLVFAAPTLLLLVPPATDALAPVAKAAPLGLLGLIVVYAMARAFDSLPRRAREEPQ